MHNHGFALLLAVAISGSTSAQISKVDPAELTTTNSEEFTAFAGGIPPGTNYDNVIEATSIAFAERFAGQMLAFSGNFDIVTGTPNDPLSLQVGAPNENLDIFLDLCTFSNSLAGLGPLGFPDVGAIGEGAVAVLFAIDQCELGLDITGVDGGGLSTFDFFRRDGSLIDTISFDPMSNGSFAFRREGNVEDIAGVVITNTDADGVAYDNIKYDAPPAATPGLDIKPGSCPNQLNNDDVLCVALVGTDSFDVMEVDLNALLLSRADGIGGGVAPIGFGCDDDDDNEGDDDDDDDDDCDADDDDNEGPFADVATPFEGVLCDCHELGVTAFLTCR